MNVLNYAGEEGDSYHRHRHAEIFGNKPLIEAWGRYAKQVYFKRLRPGGRLLEVGAGLGHHLAAVKDTNETFAIEPARIAREHCQSLGLKAYGALEDLPAGLAFDAIFLRHVLEHIPEPRKFLEGLKKFLAPGGEIILVLPLESPYARIAAHDEDHHLYCWNRQTIANLLQATGFSIREARLHWFNGRRIFLSVYRMFGVGAYGMAMRVLGRIRRCAEMVVFAGSETT